MLYVRKIYLIVFLIIIMLKNKVIVITGASSGIGYDTAYLLSKYGAKIAIGARRIDRLKKLADKINADGGTVLTQKLDVTKKQQCDKFIDTVINKWKLIDVLINNAGLMPLSFVKNLKINEWNKMIDVNIKGVLYCTASALPYMIKQNSGHIINISSVAGRIVFPAGSIYCATKHAINAFSEGLRQELSSKHNIRITLIEPGVVNTELTNTITDASLKGFIENTKKIIALKSIDIAKTILFAIRSPNHVNMNEILIRPTSQKL